MLGGESNRSSRLQDLILHTYMLQASVVLGFAKFECIFVVVFYGTYVIVVQETQVPL